MGEIISVYNAYIHPLTARKSREVIHECLSGCFSTFYLVVSRKKRNFAAKLDVELNEWRMKQVEERYISLLTDFGFDRLFEEAEIAKFTPQEMREYETSKMAYRDIKNSVDTAKREGIAEGKEIGMKEGMEKGMEKGREEGRAEGMNLRSLEIARKMLAKGMDEASIMDMTGLTAEEIKLLKAEM